MSGHAKPIKQFGNDARRQGSDYGGVFPACFDEKLRGRVVDAIITARRKEHCDIDHEELREIATYIAELESIILRHHWGRVPSDKLLVELKRKTGLDIVKQAKELDADLLAS